MQIVINFVSKMMVKVMGTSGAESLSCAANIFAGQTEAPLVVRPYIDNMTRSELLP
jgi:CNT family concentrative nucleoside transporter